MSRYASKFINLKRRQEGFVTFGDNNRGRILGRGDVRCCVGGWVEAYFGKY